MKQTILITGASSGFGFMLANKLHESGYNVVGSSVFFAIQHFAYKTFEKSIIKTINKFKI